MSLLLTAHPDDECMFFTPILHQVTHIYCLSNGNNDGLGAIREKEFINSCDTLQVNGSIGPLQDGKIWETADILKLVKIYLKRNNISKVYTFDNYGVSGHTNHISLYKALMSSDISFYSLQSVPIYRKYIGLYDLFFTLLLLPFSKRALKLASPVQVVKGYYSMMQHKSQMVWFRYLYILFSRFMWINEFIFNEK